MKILIISRSFPSDFHTKVHGAYQRLRMFVDGAKEIASIDMLFYLAPDFDVDPSFVASVKRSFWEHWKVELDLFFCSTATSQAEHTVFEKILNIVAGSMSFFSQPGYKEVSGLQQVKAFETCLRHEPDAILVDRLHSMCPLLLTKKRLPPVFLNLDDIDHVALKRTARNRPWRRSRFLLYARVPRLVLAERQAIRLARRTFVCSDVDRHYLSKSWRLPNVVTVPNAVAIPKELPLTDELTILFIGSYTFGPNIEAAEFLLEKVWPQVQKEMPKARLIIAGASPERVRGYDSSKAGIEFTGFVEDLESLYKRARIICAPIFVGAGTRVKIIEAAAYGKPIVATRIGAEGIDFRDGQEILIRDEVDSFIESCLLLLRDMTFCKQLGAAARARAIQLYDRNNVLQLIRRYLKNEGEDLEPIAKSCAR